MRPRRFLKGRGGVISFGGGIVEGAIGMEKKE